MWKKRTVDTPGLRVSNIRDRDAARGYRRRQRPKTGRRLLGRFDDLRLLRRITSVTASGDLSDRTATPGWASRASRTASRTASPPDPLLRSGSAGPLRSRSMDSHAVPVGGADPAGTLSARNRTHRIAQLPGRSLARLAIGGDPCNAGDQMGPGSRRLRRQSRSRRLWPPGEAACLVNDSRSLGSPGSQPGSELSRAVPARGAAFPGGPHGRPGSRAGPVLGGERPVAKCPVAKSVAR
jgi:hypothetical protein